MIKLYITLSVFLFTSSVFSQFRVQTFPQPIGYSVDYQSALKFYNIYQLGNDIFLKGKSCAQVGEQIVDINLWLELNSGSPSVIPKCNNGEVNITSIFPETLLFGIGDKLSQITTLLKEVENVKISSTPPPNIFSLTGENNQIFVRGRSCQELNNTLIDFNTWEHSKKNYKLQRCSSLADGQYKDEIEISEYLSEKIKNLLSDGNLVSGPNCWGTLMYLKNQRLSNANVKETSLHAFLQSENCKTIKYADRKPGDIFLYGSKSCTSKNCEIGADDFSYYGHFDHAAVYSGGGLLFEKRSYQGWDTPGFIAISTKNTGLAKNCMDYPSIESKADLLKRKNDDCGHWGQVWRCKVSDFFGDLVQVAGQDKPNLQLIENIKKIDVELQKRVRMVKNEAQYGGPTEGLEDLLALATKNYEWAWQWYAKYKAGDISNRIKSDLSSSLKRKGKIDGQSLLLLRLVLTTKDQLTQIPILLVDSGISHEMSPNYGSLPEPVLSYHNTLIDISVSSESGNDRSSP